MARPRVFVSSTFYDLRQVRADLDRFIRSIGYEAVLNENGQIPYGKDEALEEYCYREVMTVDILVAVVGGRFGSPSQQSDYSITQKEIKTALANDKPVYVFVQREVHAEYDTYKRNKGNDSIVYAAVTDKKVYAFLEEIYSLPNNNPVAPFERSEDITEFLRAQWAGLFQRFLSEQTKKQEAKLVGSLAATTATLNELVQLLSEREPNSKAVAEILLTTHPFFEELRRITRAPYRLFFPNRNELVEWLKARGYTAVDDVLWDDPEFEEWVATTSRAGKKQFNYLHIKTSIFEDTGKLKLFTPSEWDPKWVYIKSVEEAPTPTLTDDDIPF